MECFLVGGAVRDKLLALPVHDRDWVVVGATPQQMLSLGYMQFKNNFPVFLHPDTKEEYALARKESKIGSGYNGFAFDISPDIRLETDLARRDITINAIAETTDGTLIDPFHGIDDLKNKKLRHVSSAFVQDPMRLLRISRFMAKFAHLGFSIAPETKSLLQAMANSEILFELTPESIWKETEKSFSEKNCEKFFETLLECGAVSKVFPYFRIDETVIKVLKNASELTKDPMIRFAVIVHSAINTTEANDALYKRIHCPHEFKALSNAVSLYYKYIVSPPSAQVLLELFGEFHLFNKNIGRFFDASVSQPFHRFIETCQIIASLEKSKFDPAWLLDCAQKVNSYDSSELISQGFNRKVFKEKLREKRLEIIERYLQNMRHCEPDANEERDCFVGLTPSSQ